MKKFIVFLFMLLFITGIQEVHSMNCSQAVKTYLSNVKLAIEELKNDDCDAQYTLFNIIGTLYIIREKCDFDKDTKKQLNESITRHKEMMIEIKDACEK